jgi:hypothetical protein
MIELFLLLEDILGEINYLLIKLLRCLLINLFEKD